MTTPLETEMPLEQFVRVRDFIYSKLGLFFEDAKVYFIQKRVERRLEALGLERVEDYMFHLRFCDPEGQEMQALANLITTNETYMFREYEQLEAFSNHCLPEVLEAKQKRKLTQLRLWSAGCSSGEEPYTLAIILREVLDNSRDWDLQIVATDIDEEVLRMAEKALYGDRSVKPVPPEYVERHLVAERGGHRIHPDTKALVKLQHLNLHDRAAMRSMRNFDFIFCRNVLIYFDDASRKSVVDHFYNALNPGGYIFLGHSESIGRISSAFDLVRAGDFLVYKKASHE